MPYCNNCKLEIKTNKCPLCLSDLNNNKDDKEIVYEKYPSYEWFYKMQKKINAKKIVLLSSLIAIIALIIINIASKSKYNWAVISVSSIIFGYCSYICFTNASLYIRQKLLIEFFMVLPFIIIVDIFTGFHKWSLNYAVSYLSLALNITIFLTALIDRKYFNEYISYIISASFISMLTMIFPLFHFSYIGSLISFAAALIIILAMLILFRIDFISSLKKIFHL